MQKTVRIAIYVLAMLAATIWIVNGATLVKQRLGALNAQTPLLESGQN